MNSTPATDPKIAEAMKAAEEGKRALLAWIENILSVSFQGIAASLPQVRPEILLLTACRVMGRLAGRMYIGEEFAVRQFRKNCLDAFKEEMFAQEIKPMPAPPVKQDTAPMQKVN